LVYRVLSENHLLVKTQQFVHWHSALVASQTLRIPLDVEGVLNFFSA